jgi:putative hemolysin
MGAIAAEVVVILLLLLVNAVFSMSELAVMTARRSRLEHRAEGGDAGARAALDLAARPTAFLSTVQVGITLVGVLAGAFGGAGISAALAERLRAVSWLAPYAETVAFTLVVAAITYLSLIVGELVPKRIALSDPERVASLVARPMRGISRVGGPLVRALTGSTNFVLRLLGLGTVSEPGVTEQDIRALVEQGAESGVVQEGEREIVENAFRLGDRAVDALMTPRHDVQWVDLADEPASVRTQLAEAARDRFLVCDGDLDHVVGVVHAEDLLVRCMGGGAVADAAALRALARPPSFVPATMPALRLLDTFRRTRQHAAVVLDEYGAVAGLVTLDDVLEALVGDVPEEGGTDIPDFARQPDGSWLIDATAPLVDVESRLDIAATPEERADVVTFGGFVMARLGHVPREGDGFDWAGWRVRVVRMAGRRIAVVSVAESARGDGTSTPIDAESPRG